VITDVNPIIFIKAMMQKWMKYIHGVMQQPLVDVTSAIVENCSKLKFSGQ